MLQNGRVNLPELTFSFLDPQILVPLPHPNPNRPEKELGLPTHPLGDQGTPPIHVQGWALGGTYLREVSALLLPWVQPGTTEDKTKNEEWAWAEAGMHRPSHPAPAPSLSPSQPAASGFPGASQWCRAPPGALHSTKHHPWTAPVLKPRKIKTDQILVGGLKTQEENTRMLCCPGPRPSPTFPFPSPHWPLAELKEVKSLSPPDSLVQSHG